MIQGFLVALVAALVYMESRIGGSICWTVRSSLDHWLV